MFKRAVVNSVSDMNTEIFKFLNTLSGANISNNIAKIKTIDNNHIIWFIKETSGLSVWVTDIGDETCYGDELTDNPRIAKSTYAFAGKFAIDLARKEVDTGATNTARSQMVEQIQAEYEQAVLMATTTHDYLEAYKTYIRQKLPIDNYYAYKDVYHRVYGTNIYHFGGALMYNNANPVATVSGQTVSYKFIDCHYNNGCFMFVLHSGDLTNTTKMLIVGEMDTYAELTHKVFMITNSYIMHSENKPTGYKDALLLKSVSPVQADIQHSIYGETRTIDYDSELFMAVRFDEPNNVGEYSFGGNDAHLRWSVNPLRLQTHMENRYGVGQMTSEMIVGWQYSPLHSMLESTETNVGASIYPMLGDRIGTGGSDINTRNGNSVLIPLIFYILRDPNDINSWSAIGQTDIVNYVNMYNMSSGRILQGNKLDNHACYTNLSRRFKKDLFYPYYEDNNTVQEVGFKGYVGIGFKLCINEDLSLIHERLVE